jgi:hypothetical protein
LRTGELRLILKLVCLAAIATGWSQISCAQDLAPRAYIITPIHGNAVTLTYSFYSGSYNLAGVAPVTNATGNYDVQVATYYHSSNFFGRSANATLSLPYGVGTFQGDVAGVHQQVYRSGLVDLTTRISVNLIGGPAMPVRQFVKWKQKSLLGISLRVVAPTGQYDPTKLVNWSANRWAFKPELGYSGRWNKWVLDGYAGAWFFTTNPRFYSPQGPKPQTEDPITALETHLSYDLKPRLWLSLDGNFWAGGRTSLDGVPNPSTRQTSSRIGATASFPITKHQSIKFSYNDGAYTRFGENYQSVSFAWQYSWFGRPK